VSGDVQRLLLITAIRLAMLPQRLSRVSMHACASSALCRVVKSRLDECCRLQPMNPVPFKLRADWCLRFPGHADREVCMRDFQRAIRCGEGASGSVKSP